MAQVVRDLRRGPWPEAHRQRLAELQAEAQAIVERHREEFRRRGGTIDDMQKSEAIAAEEARTHVTKAINDFDTDYARSRLVNHDDDTVRRTAGDLILDRYELSKIFAKQGNIETEEEQLPVLVPRAVNELRSAIVGAKVRELTQRLATLPPTIPKPSPKQCRSLLSGSTPRKNTAKSWASASYSPAASDAIYATPREWGWC